MAALCFFGCEALLNSVGGDDDDDGEVVVEPDDDDDDCGNVVVEWSCEDGVCYCDSGPNLDWECFDPDDSDDPDDENNCDIYCAWCDE